MEHQKERALTNTQRGVFAVVHYLLTHFKGEEIAPTIRTDNGEVVVSGVYEEYEAMYLCPFKSYDNDHCVIKYTYRQSADPKGTVFVTFPLNGVAITIPSIDRCIVISSGLDPCLCDTSNGRAFNYSEFKKERDACAKIVPVVATLLSDDEPCYDIIHTTFDDLIGSLPVVAGVKCTVDDVLSNLNIKYEWDVTKSALNRLAGEYRLFAMGLCDLIDNETTDVLDTRYWERNKKCARTLNSFDKHTRVPVSFGDDALFVWQKNYMFDPNHDFSAVVSVIGYHHHIQIQLMAFSDCDKHIYTYDICHLDEQTFVIVPEANGCPFPYSVELDSVYLTERWCIVFDQYVRGHLEVVNGANQYRGSVEDRKAFLLP